MSVYERWAFVLLILGVHAKIDEVLWAQFLFTVTGLAFLMLGGRKS